MFGKEIELIKRRLDFFLHNKEWYVKKGIPYTFGLLLHGEPGCGKTSVIKAISNMTGRHIVNLGFHEHLTKTQMEHLFLDPSLHVSTHSSNNTVEQYTIPIHKRIYVIEDIDCGNNNIVFDRELQKQLHPHQGSPSLENENQTPTIPTPAFPTNNTVPMAGGSGLTKQQQEAQKKLIQQSQNEKITLAFLLNLLDGVLETPGRILIMTSNYPEKLDRALIRPGRIDLSLHFKKCDQSTVIEMYDDFYNTQTDSLSELQDQLFSPAEVNQILFSNFENPTHATTQLLEKQQSNIIMF